MTIVLAALATLAGTAAATPAWQPAETLEIVRGTPRPDVGINAAGNSTIAFSSSGRMFDSTGIVVGTRAPGGAFGVLGARPSGLADPQVAVAPNGATAIAAADRGRLFVTLYPAPGPAGAGGAAPTTGTPVAVDTGGRSVAGVEVGVDASGQATVVWASPRISTYQEPPGQVFAATVSPPGAVTALTALGAPGHCRPDVDVNLRGDVVVSRNCIDRPDDVFYKPAGGAFGGPETPFAAGDAQYEARRVATAIDGGGSVHALEVTSVYVSRDSVEERVAYATRPAGAAFGPPEALPGEPTGEARIEAQEDGDVIAAWPGGYTHRAPGAGFGPVVSLPGGFPGFDLVTSPHGPALVTWREEKGVADGRTQQIVAARIAPGAAPSVSRVGVRGHIEPQYGTTAFAINDSGQAVGAWEQRCSRDGALAVMAVALDERSSAKSPPCQDRRAPRVIVVRERAAVRGRVLRVRVACDEACRLTASSRILRAGTRKPIATAKTRAEQRLAARRGGWLRLRLSRAEVQRIGRAKRARRKVTVRLGVSVRDVYGTGRIWRLRVPLR